MRQAADPNVFVEYLRGLFLYDPITGVVTNRVRRNYNALEGMEAGTSFLNAKGQRYRRIRLGHKMVLMHRLIWKLQTGKWPRGEVDHVDGDGMNNRWSNLRDVTPSVNAANLSRLRIDNKSGTQGVSFIAGRGWVVQLNHQGKRVHWSTHCTEEAAVAMRRQVERQYFPDVDFPASFVREGA